MESKVFFWAKRECPCVVDQRRIAGEFGVTDLLQDADRRRGLTRPPIGIIVDAVSEVLRIAHDQIAPPPPTIAGLGREYLTGLVKLGDRLLILLDIDKILRGDEAAALDAVAL